MKNFIYILFATLILSSCSSDDDNISSPSDDAKLYSVNLTVKNPSLTIDQSQIRSAVDDGELKAFTISIYKGSGYIYTNIKYDIASIKQEDGSYLIPLKLPADNYKLAILGSSKSVYSMYFDSNNFYTDYYYGSVYDNEGIFYSTTDFTIKPQDVIQNVTSVELEPMWSNINITIEDAQTFDVPEGTNELKFVVDPFYNGFGIYNKLATKIDTTEPRSNIIIDLNTIRANSSYRNTIIVSKTTADNNQLKISINYLKKESDSKYTTLGTRELKIPDITIENGYNYNISGKLDANNTKSMNISLGEFNKENVAIDF